MPPGKDLAGWLRLALAPGLGPERQRRLLAAFGLPEAVFQSSRSAIASVIGNEAADRLLAPPDGKAIDAALAWADEPGNHILTLADADYPPALLEISDPPALLYLKGEPALLQRPALAVVGARSATANGEANAAAFARALGEAGLVIVSGLAAGIDAAAHRGALAASGGAGTVAVIGTGPDRIYPASNAELARQIAQAGAILSEFPLGAPALRHHFPRRNRLIAGLSLGVLVVEAAVGSGSLITARLATETGREVFAIPGSIHSPLARGCHRLIRDGAKLVETAEDVLEELRGRFSPAQHAPSTAAAGPDSAPPPPADPAAALVLALIGHEPVDIELLVQRSGLTVDALYAILLPMELDGRIGRCAGSRFQRL
ncbi:DNA-processing protein DprA [Azoarcus olearius]|uniref:DNA processing protein DrpA n=1 Tax=Azoarcus sp. (strain BH72) TaxID=418699 RepID=A1K1L0_AZOSB|nr:DNA-processing protein DprA [Azoarcus olearius]CAL92715.1 putative DNA processing protein DrpA [Azoarcus olearius]